MQEDGLWRQRYNFELYDHSKTEIIPIVRFIKIQRLKWLGHVERMEEGRATRKTVFGDMGKEE